MTYLAYIDLEANGLPRCTGWASVLAAEGCEIKPLAGADITRFGDFVINAAALWLSTDTFLQDPAFVEMIHEAIREGKRLFVQLDPNNDGSINNLLDPYGIEGTRLGIYTDGTTGHPRLIRLDRQQHGGAFRDAALLDDVDAVVVQQPQAIQYGGDATPVLTIPMREHGMYNLDTDFPENWTSPEVTCLCLGELDSSSGGVLASSGSLFHDSYVGPLGHRFPGVTANKRLAENVARWLLEPAAAEATAIRHVSIRRLGCQ